MSLLSITECKYQLPQNKLQAIRRLSVSVVAVDRSILCVDSLRCRIECHMTRTMT